MKAKPNMGRSQTVRATYVYDRGSRCWINVHCGGEAIEHAAWLNCDAPSLVISAGVHRVVKWPARVVALGDLTQLVEPFDAN